MAEHCQRLARPDADKLDAWFRTGVPEELSAHAASCRSCADAIEDLERWRLGLGELRASTATRGADIDVRAAVLADIAAEGAPSRSAGRGRWLVPAFAAGVAAALLWSWSGGDDGARARIAALDGRIVVGARTVAAGEGALFGLPTLVYTEAEAGAAVAAGLARAELWPESRVGISEDDWNLEAGGMTVEAALPVDIHHRVADIRGRGRLSVESAAGEDEEHAMKILRKHKVAGAAVLAVAVYSGWATLSLGGEDTAIRGPGGALVGEDGEVRRFGLDGAEGDPSAVGRVGASSGGAGDPTGAADVDLAAGAFWDEDRELVVFAVPGEVFDAATGTPVTAFRVTAVAEESKAYGQSQPVVRSFSDADEGRFRLLGLGLGTWRLRFEAEGFAPLTLTLPLAGLDADPYLVVPLSEGAQLTGQVVDWRGKPVGGAQVGLLRCFADDGTAVSGCGVAETGSDGTFVLPGLPEGETFALRAHHPRYGVAVERDQRREVGSTAHVRIELSGTLRITGEVTAGRERRPVPGALVTTGEGDPATTDASGRYELFAPLEAHPQVYVERARGRDVGRVVSHPESRSAWEISWVDADSHVAELSIDFRLAMENGSITGRVTDEDGAPLAGIELNLQNTAGWTRRDHESYPTRAVTGAGGRYSIENVPVGAGYLVRYRSDDDAEWSDLGYVNVPDEKPVEANFRLGGGTIRGRFVRAGEPVTLSIRDCSSMGARGAGSSVFHLPECYPDGRFELAGLPPGRYELVGRTDWIDGPVSFTPTAVTVAAGGITPDVEVEVEGEEAATWQFRVLDGSGKFVLGAYLRHHAKGTSYTSNLQVGEDGVGRASISRSFDEVFIDAPGFASHRVALSGRDPAEVIEVKMTRAAD